MATFNGERFIERQLTSVLSQLSDVDEVIVSDDSSTDRTLEVINSVDDARIRIYPSNRFANPTFNFEHALSKASNDVLVLCDQDDEWLPNKADLIRSLFRAPPCRAYAVILDGCIINEAGEQIHASLFKRLNSGPGVLKNLYDNTFQGCCMAFTREVFEIASPFPRNIAMHDMWLGQIASVFGRVDFVEEKTIRYRKHEQSLTDFKRQFRPVVQIVRRWNLASRLAARTWSRRSRLASRLKSAPIP